MRIRSPTGIPEDAHSMIVRSKRHSVSDVAGLVVVADADDDDARPSPRARDDRTRDRDKDRDRVQAGRSFGGHHGSFGHGLVQSLRIYAERARHASGGTGRCVAALALLALAALGAVLCAALWLRPELLGYQWYMQPWSPDCFVVQRGFKTGGNANRMEALFYAQDLAQARGFRYIAVPPDWQNWLCKLYDENSIRAFPVPLVPVGSGAGCPSIFFPLFEEGLRDAAKDTCEEWHLANFFRLPWYATPEAQARLDFSAWGLFLPSGHGFREAAEARLAALREAHPGKKVVTVHKRWLSVSCSKGVNPSSISPANVMERYCHMTPGIVVELLASVGLALADVVIVVSSDGYVKEEESGAGSEHWNFVPDDVPFMVQVWTWILSDVHIGHPFSTIDRTFFGFRFLFVVCCVSSDPLHLLHCAPSKQRHGVQVALLRLQGLRPLSAQETLPKSPRRSWRQ